MNESQSYKSKILFYLIILLTGVGYYWLCYLTKRENFYQVLFLFTFLFAAYFTLYKFFSFTHFKYLLIAGVLFRILILFSVPNLSDDVYRFIWDGRLAANGINPYSLRPSEVMQMPPVKGITNELFRHLNSPDYYTIYPPVLQGLFWLAAKAFPVNVFAAIVFLKSSIVAVECGTVFLLVQLLKEVSLAKHFSLLYFLNPLIITELTGNVHFEGTMIFFVLFAFLLLLKNKWLASAVCLALGIATKLIPVLFLPLLVLKLGWKKGWTYAVLTGIVTLILFTPLLDLATVQNLMKSVDLFIQRFEFNASLYYIFRWIGTIITGYNIIALAGPAFTFTAACIIFYISFRNNSTTNQSFFSKALFISTIWYLFATTVHSWYICLPVAMAVFTPYRFALIWSFTALLSYAAYQSSPVSENLWLIAAGYLWMLSFAWWEWKKNKNLHTSMATNIPKSLEPS